MLAYNVQVPPATFAGATFHANVNGQLVSIVVPNGVGPGATLQIKVPAPAAPPAGLVPRRDSAQTRVPLVNNGPVAQLKRQQTAAALRPKPPNMADERRHAEQANAAASAAAAERKKEAEHAASALGQMEQKKEAREAAACARDAKRAGAPGAGPAGERRPSGEVSALWWLNMGI